MARSDARFGALMSAPALLIILVVVAFPLLYSLWMSLAEVNLLKTSGPALEFFGIRLPLFRFVGLENYIRVFTDPLYWSSLARTVYFVAAFVVEATLVGLGMALVLHQRFRGRPLMRAVLLIPWALSRVAVGILWQGLLDADFGALNGILHRLGLIDSYIGFFANGFSALNVLVSVYMWNQAPFATVLFLAGLQAIPRDLQDGARVEGASEWRVFRHVTWPLLGPVSLYVAITAILDALRNVDHIFVLTRGGPANATNVLLYETYLKAFEFWDTGRASAVTVMMVVALLGLAVVAMPRLERGIHYEA